MEQTNVILKRLCEEARKIFSIGLSESLEGYFSPGRVNLIGEHTDYNGGYVFPCALSFGTYAIVKRREDKVCRMYSNNFKELGIFEISLEEIVYDEKDDWTNYPKGVIDRKSV